MTTTRLKLIDPTAELRTVPPGRRPNADLRSREYLLETEVAALMTAVKANRYGHRDSTIILTCFRHGLRVSELIDLRWDQLDFNTANVHVRRSKRGTAAVHPVLGDELRALRRLQREQLYVYIRTRCTI